MQTSPAPALRLSARSILALLAAIGLLLGGSPLAWTHSFGRARVPGIGHGRGFDAAVTASAKTLPATSLIAVLPRSHGAPAFRLRRALVRQLAAHGGPQLAVSSGPVLLPAATLLGLERLTSSAAHGVLGFVRPGRGPPQQAGN